MRKLLVITLIYLVNTSALVIAQNVKVVKADALTDRIENSSDTVFVVNFWATWCAPCVEELPVFKSKYYKTGNNVVKILLVSLDFKNAFDELEKFIQQHNIEEEVLWMDEKNPNSWINNIDENWSGAIPATKIYHTDKEVFHEGQITVNQLQKMINKLK